jgi:predicted MFS family arabinose efflux permease
MTVPSGASLLMPRRVAICVFLSFAFTYFFSALVRGVTATLAPLFSVELGLSAGDLGLLAGAYFFGFAAMQLPMGSALDRHGPRRVLLTLLVLAASGCIAFALARDFFELTLARGLIGVGVSACLMAPMTSFRNGLRPEAQIRATSWMLMTGSLGMVAATLPVQWVLPLTGWRGLFWCIGAAIALAMAAIWALVPVESPPPASRHRASGGYAEVFRHRTFLRFAPIGFFQYGGMIAIQSLWAGPWLVQVCDWTPEQSARGLFAINAGMLLCFMALGAIVPRLYRQGRTAQQLIALGLPVSLAVLWAAVALGAGATAWVWLLFCTTSTLVSLSQPAVGQAFPSGLAGRALSAYNLVVFAGVFCVQWTIGLLIDHLRTMGWSTLASFQGAFATFAGCCALAYVWFLVFDDRLGEAEAGSHLKCR